MKRLSLEKSAGRSKYDESIHLPSDCFASSTVLPWSMRRSRDVFSKTLAANTDWPMRASMAAAVGGRWRK